MKALQSPENRSPGKTVTLAGRSLTSHLLSKIDFRAHITHATYQNTQQYSCQSCGVKPEMQNASPCKKPWEVARGNFRGLKKQ